MDPVFLITGIALLIISSVLAFFAGRKATKGDSAGYIAKLELREHLIKELTEERNQQQKAREEAEKQVVRLEEQNSALKEHMEDWNKTKEEHRQAVKASVLETSRELSNKLLEDHKRESEQAKKDNEKRIKETTEELHSKFQKVFGSLDNLHTKTKEMDIVRQALLNPSGAGNLGEITMENIFKASGLIKDKDFFLQFSLEGPNGQLKPDAVVSLPGNNIMIVDAKISRFFMEIANAAENDSSKKEAEAGLKRSMNEHLKGLVLRDYKYAFEQRSKNNKAMGEIASVSMLMFLPSETALEKLRKIDKDFMEKAWREQVIPVGPSGLINMLIYSKMEINRARQIENIEHISGEVKNLLKGVATLYNHSGGLGRSIQSSFKKYNDFARSFNRTFLSSVTRLEKLGMTSPKDEKLPKLETYHFITDDFDGEAEEITETRQLEEA